VGKGGEGRRREGRAGDGKFALAPSKYIWIDAAGGVHEPPAQSAIGLPYTEFNRSR